MFNATITKNQKDTDEMDRRLRRKLSECQECGKKTTTRTKVLGKMVCDRCKDKVKPTKLTVDGLKIQDIRLEKGMSQEDLALRVGYKGQVSISYIENGKTIPKVDKFAKLAQALDMKMEELIKEVE